MSKTDLIDKYQSIVMKHWKVVGDILDDDDPAQLWWERLDSLLTKLIAGYREAERLREGIVQMRDEIDLQDGLFRSAELYTRLSAILDEPPRIPLAPKFKRKKHFIPAVALDFDGVVHAYTSRWTTPGEINDGPTPGALDAVQSYRKAGYDVIIYSVRARDGEGKAAIRAWMEKHGFPPLEVTHMKPHAKIYIDDRGYRFTGNNFPSVVEIQAFRPWNRKR